MPKISSKSKNNSEPTGENQASETLISTVDKIRNNPSAEYWAEELNNIFDKLRNVDISQIGDVSRYIEVIISGAKSPNLARQTFLSALNEFLQSWQPLSPDQPERRFYILSIIKGFTPKVGFNKLIGCLKTTQFKETFMTPMGWKVDFQLLSLVTLENYYLAPPLSASEDTAYQTYLDIVKSNFEIPEYFGYCAARLIDLKVLSFNSDELFNGLREHQQGLNEIINLALKNPNPDIAGRNLSYIYVHCSGDADLLKEFKKCIERYGKITNKPLAQVEHQENWKDSRQYPSLYLFRKNNVTIEISPKDDDTYRDYDQLDLNLEKFETLIESYRSPKVLLKDSLKQEIVYELTAVIEKALTTKNYSVQDVIAKLKKIGGEIVSTDSEYRFDLDRKAVVFLKISPGLQSKLWFELNGVIGSTRKFNNLIDSLAH